METRRIIGVVTVKNGLAVQSFGYEKYYPLGRPEIFDKNLTLGADEILLNLIDRSPKNNGPDFDLINNCLS